MTSRKRNSGPFKIDRDPGPPLSVGETGRLYGLTDKQIADVVAWCDKHAPRSKKTALKMVAAFADVLKKDAT